MLPTGAAPVLRLVRPAEIPSGDDQEFTRVLRIADPSPALEGGGTFLPAAGSKADAWLSAWEQWRTQLFAEHLASALAGAARHAAGGYAREIREIDRALAAALPPAEAERSAAAGRSLYQAMTGVRGERWFNKLQAWTTEGSLPAHLPVAYACRYVSFHLPGRLLLPTYAYWEWTAALALRPPAEGRLPDFASVMPAPDPEVVPQALGVD